MSGISVIKIALCFLLDDMCFVSFQCKVYYYLQVLETRLFCF